MIFVRPHRLLGPSAVFCLGAVLNEMVGTVAFKTMFLELFVGLDSISHLHINRPVPSYRGFREELWQIGPSSLKGFLGPQMVRVSGMAETE